MFFDPESRFYERYKRTVITGIRHNVVFTNKYKKNGMLRSRNSEGGVHKSDLGKFILAARKSIEEQQKKFDELAQSYLKQKGRL